MKAHKHQDVSKSQLGILTHNRNNSTTFSFSLPGIMFPIDALLSPIAFHITRGENLPNIGYIVTADLFSIFTYALIFLSIVETVISNALSYKGNLEQAVRVFKISVVLFPFILLLIIGFVFLNN